jgi:hypothetical protein
MFSLSSLSGSLSIPIQIGCGAASRIIRQAVEKNIMMPWGGKKGRHGEGVLRAEKIPCR